MREAIVLGPVVNTAKRIIDGLQDVDYYQQNANDDYFVTGELTIYQRDPQRPVAVVRWDNDLDQWVLAAPAPKS